MTSCNVNPNDVFKTQLNIYDRAIFPRIEKEKIEWEWETYSSDQFSFKFWSNSVCSQRKIEYVGLIHLKEVFGGLRRQLRQFFRFTNEHFDSNPSQVYWILTISKQKISKPAFGKEKCAFGWFTFTRKSLQWKLFFWVANNLLWWEFFHVQTDFTRHRGRDLLGSQIPVTTGGFANLLLKK